MTTMTVTVPVEITARQIADEFVTAFEGGSNYWLQSAKLVTSDNRSTPRISPWYDDEAIYTGQFAIALGFDDPMKDEGNGEGRKTITESDVAEGLRRMADKYPHQFGLLKDDAGDACTADVFLQCVVLGDIVYG